MDEDVYPLLDAAPAGGSNVANGATPGETTQPTPQSGPPSGLEGIFGSGDLGE